MPVGIEGSLRRVSYVLLPLNLVHTWSSKVPDHDRADKKIHVRLLSDLHRRVRGCCPELGPTIQDFVVDLLERGLGGMTGVERQQRHVERLPEHPIVTVTRVVEMLGCSRPAAGKALRTLEEAAVLWPLDDHKKNRALVLGEYLGEPRHGAQPI